MKKEWKKKASFEYRIPDIFCTFKLFIGNKYKILLPTPVFIICTSNNCIFRKNRALAPHERSAVPLGTDHCPVC